MLTQDNTTKLLNLEDVKITNIENISGQLHIWLELPRKEHVCPCCGAKTDRIHDYRMQTIKDIPMGRQSFLHLRKRRYRCCCGKRFLEKNNFVPRYYRVTSRLVATIFCAFEDTISAKKIASTYNVSSATAMRYFRYYGHKLKELPPVISIDEFKGNSGGHKYNCILANPIEREILDILPTRYESDLVRYFAQFHNKSAVKYFVCDMNPHFRRVAETCFPDAIIVADKFHVVRQAVWAMERVRKNEQSKLPSNHRRYFKKSRYLLMKDIQELKPGQMDQLALMFEIAPRLADAYRIKNELISIMRGAGHMSPRAALGDWIQSVEYMDLPEFKDCLTAYRNWFSEIVHAIEIPLSNGFIEGLNNKTKVLKRVCYGMRNFENFRKRILFCHSRRSA